MCVLFFACQSRCASFGPKTETFEVFEIRIMRRSRKCVDDENVRIEF